MAARRPGGHAPRGRGDGPQASENVKEEPCPGAQLSLTDQESAVRGHGDWPGRCEAGLTPRDTAPGNRQALTKLMHLLKSTLPVTIVPKNPEDQVGVAERGLVGQKAEPGGKVRAASPRGI